LVSQKVDHEGKHLEIYFWDYHNKILHRPDALYKTNSVTQTLTVLKYVWSVFPAVIWHILFMSPPDQICPAIHSFISYQICECDILKINELILLPVGTTDPRQGHETVDFGGQEVKGQGHTTTRLK